MRCRLGAPRVVLAGAVMGVFLVAVGTLSGHVRRQNVGAWYFDGHTYTNESASERKKKDPINFIFKGGVGQASIDLVKSHIATHSAANGGPWHTLQGACALGRWRHRMEWRSWSQAGTSDKEDLDMASRFATSCDPFSDTRVHLRAWDDHEHDKVTADHGVKDQWVVGSIHHERPRRFGLFGHKVDVDWDAMRRYFVELMAGHCSDRQWRRHNGIRGKTYQDFKTTGWIARISMSHSPGCSGQ